MDFLLSMSIFSSATDIASERAKAQEWMRGWVARNDGGKGAAAAAEQGRPQQGKDSAAKVAKGPQEKRPRRTPHFAPEFDGLNCFETVVFH